MWLARPYQAELDQKAQSSEELGTESSVSTGDHVNSSEFQHGK